MRHGVRTVVGVLAGAVLLEGGPFGLPVLETAAAGRAGVAQADSGGAFVAGTGDLPLMAGLRQVPDRGVVFETAQGRIVEAYAVGFVSPAQVRDFYGDSLPQLGWRPAGPARFRREGEVLTLDFPSRTEPLTVRFRIAPEP